MSTIISSKEIIFSKSSLSGELQEARAQGELRSLIKQYDEMLHKNWDLASEEQRSRIDHMKAQTDKLTGNNAEIEDMDEIEGDIYGAGN